MSLGYESRQYLVRLLRWYRLLPLCFHQSNSQRAMESILELGVFSNDSWFGGEDVISVDVEMIGLQALERRGAKSRWVEWSQRVEAYVQSADLFNEDRIRDTCSACIIVYHWICGLCHILVRLGAWDSTHYYLAMNNLIKWYKSNGRGQVYRDLVKGVEFDLNLTIPRGSRGSSSEQM